MELNLKIPFLLKCCTQLRIYALWFVAAFVLIGSIQHEHALASTVFEELESVHREKPFLSLDDIVLALKDSYFKQFSILFRSRSVDKKLVSGPNPRVILFADSGKNLIAFPTSDGSPVSGIELLGQSPDGQYSAKYIKKNAEGIQFGSVNLTVS